MARINSSQKQEAQNKLLQYLAEYGPVRIEAIALYLNVTKQTVRNRIHSINAPYARKEDQPIQQNSRHLFFLNEKIQLRPQIIFDRKDVCEWMVLYLLASAGKNGLSERQILDAINDPIDFTAPFFLEKAISAGTVRNYLSDLEALHLIQRKTSASDTAGGGLYITDHFFVGNSKKFRENLIRLIFNSHNNQIDAKKNRLLMSRIETLLPSEGAEDTRRENPVQEIFSGRTPEVSETEFENLARIADVPYQREALSIRWVTRHAKEKREDRYYIGLIYYAAETMHFYLLGRAYDQKKCDYGPYFPIRVDRITRIKETPDEAYRNGNPFFECAGARATYEKLFSAAIDYRKEPPWGIIEEPYQVIIHFYFDKVDDTEKPETQESRDKKSHHRYVKEHLKWLTDMRSQTASLTPTIENGYNVYIYKDTVYGLSSLAATLRRIGDDYWIESPDELADMMISSYQKSISNYENLFKGQTNE